jgi:hypothetical protein
MLAVACCFFHNFIFDCSQHAGDRQVQTHLNLPMLQHMDHLGRTGEALAFLDDAQARAPDLIELHSARARFLKHGGDPQGVYLLRLSDACAV